MTSSQLILVSVTSALIAVFVMLLVASLKRARSEEPEEFQGAGERAPTADGGRAGRAPTNADGGADGGSSTASGRSEGSKEGVQDTRDG